MSGPDLTLEQTYNLYTSIWQNISREDVNCSNRINWALALTSGQFVSISFLVKDMMSFATNPLWPVMILAIVNLMSALGAFFCYRTRLGVAAAHAQIDYLLGEYRHHADSFKALCLPRPFGEGTGHRPGRKSSDIYPIALLSVWTIIFLSSFVGLVWAISRAATLSPTG